MKKILINLISNKWFFVLLFLFSAVFVSLEAINNEKAWVSEEKAAHTHYNNYTIFKQSFFHLKNKQDLYVLHEKEYFDLYKYTPTFSVFFGLFAFMPDWLGLIFWNLLNVFMILIAVYFLPIKDNFIKGIILLICTVELITSIQNEQSNGLILGLLIMSFSLLERKQLFFAVLCITFSVYIKLFGIVGFVMFLFYPQKLKLILYSVFWVLILFVLPLILIDIHQYRIVLKSFSKMLSEDYSMSYGLSVQGWLKTWFNLTPDKKYILLSGVLLFLVSIIQFKNYSILKFKFLVLSSYLIWIVIFNHKAESPTFIIAVGGIAIWYILDVKNKLNTLLFILAMIFTCFSATDIFPSNIRNTVLVPYNFKVVPCILIWLKITYDLIFFKPETVSASTI